MFTRGFSDAVQSCVQDSLKAEALPKTCFLWLIKFQAPSGDFSCFNLINFKRPRAYWENTLPGHIYMIVNNLPNYRRGVPDPSHLVIKIANHQQLSGAAMEAREAV